MEKCLTCEVRRQFPLMNSNFKPKPIQVALQAVFTSQCFSFTLLEFSISPLIRNISANYDFFILT